MGCKRTDGELKKRIRSGQVSREDVVRRLAELAFGRANDCVKLVLVEPPCVAEPPLAMAERIALPIRLISIPECSRKRSSSMAMMASSIYVSLMSL